MTLSNPAYDMPGTRPEAVDGANMDGPGALNSSFNSTLGQGHFCPALEGKAVSVLGNIDLPHTYAYVDDVAAGRTIPGSAASANRQEMISVPSISDFCQM